MTDTNSNDWLGFFKKTIKETFQNITSEVFDLFEERPSYIILKLPLNKITPELEDFLKKKVERDILLVHVRVATIEDIENIVRIYNTAWYSSSMPYRNVSKETFLKFYEKSNTIFLIANYNSLIDCGFILIHFEGQNDDIGVINGLAVLPKFQNKGLGTILALTAWNYFKKHGIKELICEIHKNNKIIYSFLKNLGFEEFQR